MISLHAYVLTSQFVPRRHTLRLENISSISAVATGPDDEGSIPLVDWTGKRLLPAAILPLGNLEDTELTLVVVDTCICNARTKRVARPD